MNKSKIIEALVDSEIFISSLEKKNLNYFLNTDEYDHENASKKIAKFFPEMKNKTLMAQIDFLLKSLNVKCDIRIYPQLNILLYFYKNREIQLEFDFT